MKHMVASLTIAAFAVGLLSASPFVSAAPNPSGTGPPLTDGFECGGVGSPRPAGATGPLATGTSPGSPFNEALVNSENGGKGGAAYDTAGAPSQYDVACFQQSQRKPPPG